MSNATTIDGPRVIIRAGKVKPIIFRHPWVYTGSILETDPGIEDGSLVTLFDEKGNFLARGCFNVNSQIAVRLISWNPGEAIDRDFFRRRLERAARLRSEVLNLDGATDCYRVVHSEADELPGLIVDRYGSYLLVQATCAGMARFLDVIIDALNDMFHPAGIYERVDTRNADGEMIDRSCRLLRGSDAADEVMVHEHGVKFLVSLKRGHKSGFFADQRDNRRLLAGYCKGRDVLDAFCYTGAFALHAAKAGARGVVAVESSAPAVELGRRNAELNGATRVEFILANAIDFLRREAEGEPRFDIVVIDPPKLAPSRKDVEKALRKYADVNRLAMQAVRRGGLLFTCSCSHHIDDRSFDRMLAEASIAAGRSTQILEARSQSPDHPIKAGVEEGGYLKGRLCRIS